MPRPSAFLQTMPPMLPAPMTPSVLPVISTPMNFDFSHLPAWVEASAAGSWRATANISAMACSAVVIELPNGVFMTMMPRREAAGMSTLSTPMPARPMTLRLVAARDQLFGHLGGRADGETVIVADDLGELFLVLAELRLEIDLDAAVAENLDGGFGQFVGYEYARCHEGLLHSCDRNLRSGWPRPKAGPVAQSGRSLGKRCLLGLDKPRSARAAAPRCRRSRSSHPPRCAGRRARRDRRRCRRRRLPSRAGRRCPWRRLPARRRRVPARPVGDRQADGGVGAGRRDLGEVFDPVVVARRSRRSPWHWRRPAPSAP